MAVRKVMELPVASTTALASVASELASAILPENSSTIGEGDGKQCEGASPASQLDLAGGEIVPPGVVAERAGDLASQPEPGQLVLLGERLVTERAQRHLQRRSPSSIALAGEEGEPVEQQVTGAWRRTRGWPPVGGEHRGGDLARIAPACQAVR